MFANMRLFGIISSAFLMGFLSFDRSIALAGLEGHQSMPQPKAQSAKPVIELAAGRLSVRIANATLSEVLRIVAEKTGATISLHAAADESVTAESFDLPLEEGLKRIAQGKNTVFFYSPILASSPPNFYLTEIRIFGAEPSRDVVVFDGIRIASSPPSSNPRLHYQQSKFSDPVIDALGQQLKIGNNAEDRKQAAENLAKTWSGASVEPLANALFQDADDSVRTAAARALGDTWSEDAIAPLAAAMLQDGSAEVRDAAARALGRSWSESATDSLIAALLQDRDAMVREQAARSLAQTAGVEAVAYLTDVLVREPRWFVREAVAEALGTLGGRDALAALRQAAIADPDSWVRETAARTAATAPN